MQMLAEASKSMAVDGKTHALIDCLGIVPGRIKLMEVGNLRLPTWAGTRLSTTRPILCSRGSRGGSYFYFVHSLCAGMILVLKAIEFRRSGSARLQNFWSCNKDDYPSH